MILHIILMCDRDVAIDCARMSFNRVECGSLLGKSIFVAGLRHAMNWRVFAVIFMSCNCAVSAVIWLWIGMCCDLLPYKMGLFCMFFIMRMPIFLWSWLEPWVPSTPTITMQTIGENAILNKKHLRDENFQVDGGNWNVRHTSWGSWVGCLACRGYRNAVYDHFRP